MSLGGNQEDTAAVAGGYGQTAARGQGAEDRAILHFAAAHGRILVTHDQRTMPEHFGNFIMSHTSAGVILVPKIMGIGDAIEELHLIWIATEAEEWVDRIWRLPV